jgi:large subunit ribosomal protein L9
MKVMLLADIYKHGVAGEVVDVANGFARNYLIPKKLAVKATAGALKQAASLRAKSEARKAQLENRLNDLARQIDGTELFFGRRASPTGKLFGSVTTSEIADELLRVTDIDINRRRISQQSLREVGTHEVPVRLGTEISPTIKVTVVASENLEAYLEERKRAAEAAEAEAETEAAEGEGLVEAVSDAVEGVVEAVTEVVEDVVEAVSDAVEAVTDDSADTTDDEEPSE